MIKVEVESYYHKTFVVIFMIAACILLIFGLTSCSGKPLEGDVPETTDSVEGCRFVWNDGNKLRGISDYEIIIDTETGVQYLAINFGGYSGVMTVLMNPDGTPITTVE